MTYDQTQYGLMKAVTASIIQLGYYVLHYNQLDGVNKIYRSSLYNILIVKI